MAQESTGDCCITCERHGKRIKHAASQDIIENPFHRLASAFRQDNAAQVFETIIFNPVDQADAAL